SANITQAGNNANISVTHTGTLSSVNVDALTAVTAGGGNVSITTSKLVQTSGASESIRAGATTGGITISTGAVFTNSTGMGMNGNTTGGGIGITTNGVVQSTGGNGINTQVIGGTGNTAITFNADVLFGNSTAVGIQAFSSSTGSMTISGSGNITKA